MVFTGFWTFGAAAEAGDGVAACLSTCAVAAAGAGVPERLGSTLTVTSLPCTSLKATGNSASLVVRIVGRCFLTRAYTESDSALDGVFIDQWNWQSISSAFEFTMRWGPPAETHLIVGNTVAHLVRNFWDDKLAFDLRAGTGRAGPFSLDSAVIDSDEPGSSRAED